MVTVYDENSSRRAKTFLPVFEHGLDRKFALLSVISARGGVVVVVVGGGGGDWGDAPRNVWH